MQEENRIQFDWQGQQFEGFIEKEYDHSVLVNVSNPNAELQDKYLGRIVISKKSYQSIIN
ncbi:DUF2187 domain-containing protein [Vagococcus silagei]|uniref:DUF2187 domain-containing protein n=1 Tax=Vagococcus silagei TaxID=2508885 RepID=A0A4V3TUZ0_9ENTE|nr:DUF2187 domain-containing protein [Vagococcus silagei]THB60839.1 DUF2187 domain-containing protein [Vagococcus silagei]